MTTNNSDTIIKVENLSKRYEIFHQQKHDSFRDLLADSFKNIFNFNTTNSTKEEFWALKDINFEVKQGEVLGIIGKNGAGKSTLLKILSRITQPTTGSVKIKGRVASLLEVGTGFHPELTGRENIYLNGAILGMKKAEIARKFDEIVDFSGVEKFLDTPVKRYSSGMYVRLAFAVAAHLEPEILIIDEVLAVGDAEFQKKCLGKMDDVSKKEGRTVLFVSHNMAAVRQLCDSCIVIKNGLALPAEETEKSISKYLEENLKKNGIPDIKERKDRKGSGIVKITGITIFNSNNSAIASGTDFLIKINYNHHSFAFKNIRLDIGMDNELDIRIAHLSTETIKQDFSQHIKDNEEGSMIFLIKSAPLIPGIYYGTICLYVDGIVSDWVSKAFFFEIVFGDFYGTKMMPPENQGNFLLKYNISWVK